MSRVNVAICRLWTRDRINGRQGYDYLLVPIESRSLPRLAYECFRRVVCAAAGSTTTFQGEKMKLPARPKHLNMIAWGIAIGADIAIAHLLGLFLGDYPSEKTNITIAWLAFFWLCPLVLGIKKWVYSWLQALFITSLEYEHFYKKFEASNLPKIGKTDKGAIDYLWGITLDEHATNDQVNTAYYLLGYFVGILEMCPMGRKTLITDCMDSAARKYNDVARFKVYDPEIESKLND